MNSHAPWEIGATTMFRILYVWITQSFVGDRMCEDSMYNQRIQTSPTSKRQRKIRRLQGSCVASSRHYLPISFVATFLAAVSADVGMRRPFS